METSCTEEEESVSYVYTFLKLKVINSNDVLAEKTMNNFQYTGQKKDHKRMSNQNIQSTY